MQKDYNNIPFALNTSVGNSPGVGNFFIHGFSETIGKVEREVIWKYGKTFEQNVALFDTSAVPVYAVLGIAEVNDVYLEIHYIDIDYKEIKTPMFIPAGQTSVLVADDVRFVNFVFVTSPTKVTQDIDFSIDPTIVTNDKIKNVLLVEYQSSRAAFQFVSGGTTLTLESFSASVGRADRAVVDGWIKPDGLYPFSPMGLRVYQGSTREQLPYYKVPEKSIVFLTGISDVGNTDIQTQIAGFEVENRLIS